MGVLKPGVLAVGMALLACLVVAACSSSPPPTLVRGLSDNPPDPAKGISGGSFRMRADIFSIELGTFLCSVRDVRITSVGLYRPSSGIRLARWGIENHQMTMNSMAAGPLNHLGPFTSHAVTQHCGRTQWYSRVGLELHRTEPGTQSFLGLRVTYNSDGQQKVAYLWEQYRLHDPGKRA